MTRAGWCAALLVLLAACGIPGQDHPTKLDNDGVHVASTTSRAPSAPSHPVQLCVIADDHLAAIAGVAESTDVGDTLTALVRLSQTALPPQTRSAIDAPDVVTARPAQHGVANIDLGAGFLDIPPADQILAIGQLVCTLTGLPGVGQVRFTQEGRPTDVPRADSSLTDQPVSRDDYRSLLVAAP